jgi:hypothetical protein
VVVAHGISSQSETILLADDPHTLLSHRVDAGWASIAHLTPADLVVAESRARPHLARGGS